MVPDEELHRHATELLRGDLEKAVQQLKAAPLRYVRK
jgi:hypothetical protein